MADTRQDESLNSLQTQELELERLRLIVGPELWPRIYSMLKRIREEIRRVEADQKQKDRAA